MKFAAGDRESKQNAGDYGFAYTIYGFYKTFSNAWKITNVFIFMSSCVYNTYLLYSQCFVQNIILLCVTFRFVPAVKMRYSYFVFHTRLSKPSTIGKIYVQVYCKNKKTDQFFCIAPSYVVCWLEGDETTKEMIVNTYSVSKLRSRHLKHLKYEIFKSMSVNG